MFYFFQRIKLITNLQLKQNSTQNSRLDCSEPTLGNVLLDKKNNETSSVTFVAISGEITDQTNSILENRPNSDNVIILANPDEHSSIYQVGFQTHSKPLLSDRWRLKINFRSKLKYWVAGKGVLVQMY